MIVFKVASPFVWRDEHFNIGPDVYAADHPAVIACRDFFTEVVPLGPPSGRVEETTANPGEKRSVGRPKKTT